MVASVRPRSIAGKTRRRIAAEEPAELVAVEAKIKKATAELKAIVLARGSHLMDLHGVGPVVAARVLADVGYVTRFADRNRCASWTGTAPLDASSGEPNRHLLSRAVKTPRPPAPWSPTRSGWLSTVGSTSRLSQERSFTRITEFNSVLGPSPSARRTPSCWPRWAASGDCYDNSTIEAFRSRMQVELLDRMNWHTCLELANAIFEYLEI